MNILFFLTPKCEIAYLEEDSSLRQALEKMEYHRYTAIPILSADGKFSGIVSEGDMLWTIKNTLNLDLKSAEQISISSIPKKHIYEPVGINSSMEQLVKKSINQNFVPVVDDWDRFIGIVTRKSLMDYLYRHVDFSKENKSIGIETMAGIK